MNNICNFLHKKYFQILLLSLAAQIFAQTGFSQEHSLLKPFPNSTLVTSTSAEDVVYQVPLGILQRIRGRAAPEKLQRVSGDVVKLLYEIPDGFDGNDVLDFFTQQFEEAGLEKLFACEGRSCGSSNDWANDVFRNRVLYGPSQNQFFMTYVDRASTGDNYFVNYIITRGNGRLYSYIELIETAGAGNSPTELSETLLRNKFIVLPDLLFEDDVLVGGEVSISDLVSVLTLNPDINLYIVAHLQATESFDRAQVRSQTRADSVAASLVEAGVDSARLTAKGVGPLSPGCAEEACRNRVEVVLR